VDYKPRRQRPWSRALVRHGAEAREVIAAVLGVPARFSSIASLKAVGYWGVPKIRALFEATYFAGLRKAGMPEE
jgi:hypothetical protein